MKVNLNDFIKELNRWHILFEEKYPRIILSGGNKEAREYYAELLQSNPEFEAEIILELAKSDADLMYAIEERAAIRKYDAHLSDDLLEAILGNFAN